MGIKRPIRFLIGLFFLSVLMLIGIHELTPNISQAQESALTYYVSQEGDDTQEGSLDHPWATLNHAAETVGAGDTVYVKGGIYHLTDQIRPQQSGTRDRPITYAAAPGEHVILDAQDIAVPAPSGKPPFAHDQGAFQLENVAYIRVRDLELTNSHNAGFTVRNSSHIQLYNNTVNTTFSSGIGGWNGTHYQIMGNTIINANLPRLTDYERDDTKQTPHEAITLGGVVSFEVAYNNVHNSAKEGIDIKETSRHGTVHHNHVHHVDRQGLYIDSWFGVLDDVELYDNVVHHCKGGGFMVSAEGGQQASNIRFHHNLIYDNWGTGIFLSRWGQDRLRKHIEIYNNTVYHNGFGPPNPGEEFHWITGGLYLFSTQLEDVGIHHNIVADNTGFQVGYSDRYLTDSGVPSISVPGNIAENPLENIPGNTLENTPENIPGNTLENTPENTPEIAAKIQALFKEKGIRIYDNLLRGDNDTQTPIYAGWAPDDFAYIYGIYGTNSNDTDGGFQIEHPNKPLFIDAYRDNFYLNPEQLSTVGNDASNDVSNDDSIVGMFPLGHPPYDTLAREPKIAPSVVDLTPSSANPGPTFWWQTNFPPHLEFEWNVA